MKSRADYGLSADAFFDALEPDQQPQALILRDLILDTIPNARESIKWGVPVYEDNKLICSIRASRRHVSLQFFDAGASLDDPDKLLQGSGKKLRHIKIYSEADIQRSLFRHWIRQAAGLI